jgi:beta-lactamase class D
MQATVNSGTASKAFGRRSRDRILSTLKVGGKTGSIFNQAHDVRFDWFVGFAEQKKGPDQLVVAAMVGHEAFIGTRAATYARMAMRYYFEKHLARMDGNSRNKSNNDG